MLDLVLILKDTMAPVILYYFRCLKSF
jgi:hypothetical protein